MLAPAVHAPAPAPAAAPAVPAPAPATTVPAMPAMPAVAPVLPGQGFVRRPRGDKVKKAQSVWNGHAATTFASLPTILVPLVHADPQCATEVGTQHV